MADQETTFRLKFENEDMEKVFKQLIDRVEETNDELKRLEKNQKEAFDATANSAQKADEAIKSQTKSLDANSVRFKNLKDVSSSAFDEIENSGNQAVSTLARLARAAGPVGAAIAAVGGAIVAAFLDVEANAKKAKAELEGLKAVGNELKDRTFAGIRAITKLWAGDLAAASIEAAKVVNGVNGTINAVREAGRNIELLRQGYSGFSRQLIQIEAERTVQLQKLQAAASDENRTTEERISLLNSVASVENKLNSTRISQLSFQLDILRKQNEAFGEEPEILDEIAAIEAELIELRGANQLIAIQTQQEINALLQAEAAARDRIIQQLRDFNTLASGTQAENAILNQIQNFEELRDAVGAAGLADQYAGEVAELDRVISGLYQRLQDGLIEPLKEIPTVAADSFQAVSETADPLSESLAEAGIQAAERLGKAFKDKFEELTADQQRFIEQQFGDIFESVSEIIVSNTIIAIGQQDQIIDAREQSISALEDQIRRQEDLEADGLANSADRLRQSLQAERQILRREQQRRLELEKRAARQRLVTNSIQQASEITLATAKLLKEGASGFIPGLIAAAGGIALLFRIIAQAKANAAAFSQPPQFREGTPWLSGPNHEGGGVLIEAEGGERIFSKKLNEMVGGREMPNEELVDFALRGMNADSAIAPMAAAVGAGAMARQVVHEVERMEGHEILARTFREEIGVLRKEMREVIGRRPTYYPTNQPGRREYWDGNTKVVEKIVPK